MKGQRDWPGMTIKINQLMSIHFTTLPGVVKQAQNQHFTSVMHFLGFVTEKTGTFSKTHTIFDHFHHIWTVILSWISHKHHKSCLKHLHHSSTHLYTIFKQYMLHNVHIMKNMGVKLVKNHKNDPLEKTKCHYFLFHLLKYGPKWLIWSHKFV